MCWKHYFRVFLFGMIAIGASIPIRAGQQPAADTVQHILDRLDSLEKQNEELLKEIHDLRQELAGTAKATAPEAPPVGERVDALEQRTAEQAQTKVGASQRFPISLTGMFLFDATDSSSGNTNPYGVVGATGASLRQSIIGLDFYGPRIFDGGQIHGSLAMDFYSGTTDSVLRIRRGIVSFDWKRRSITFGQDKPLIAPLQPTSFAHVGLPPLAGAGNLWLWLPQAEYEERIPLGANTQLKAQAEIIQTNESYGFGTQSLPYGTGIAPSRPGLEARFEYQRSSKEQPRLTLGLGAHVSTSHVLGQSLPSRVLSGDFKYEARKWLEFSGTFLHGENFSNLGGLAPGFSLTEYGAVPVRASAGWAQVAFPVTSRLTFDLYAGRQLNEASTLVANDPFRSLMYAGNVLYRIAPNVVLGFEGGQNQFTYLNGAPYSAHRFDATVAYLF